MKIRVRDVSRPEREGPQVDITLLPALEEDDRSDEIQSAFRRVEASLKSDGNEVMSMSIMQKSLDAGGGWLTGDFILHLANTIGSGALAAWLTGKLGRKVRIKIGEFEAEASNAKELDQIIDKALTVKERLNQDAGEGQQRTDG